MPEGALTLFTVCDASLLCRSGIVLTSKRRSHREYLIPTDIIVLNHFFNLTKKSNLIGILQYDLTQFFDNLVVATFLGHPVHVGSLETKRTKRIAVTMDEVFKN